MRKRVLTALFLVAICAGSVFGGDTITPTKIPGTSGWTLRLDAVWNYLTAWF